MESLEWNWISEGGLDFFVMCALTSLNASHFVLSGLRRTPPPLRGIPFKRRTEQIRLIDYE